jgi:hypothetical protein
MIDPIPPLIRDLFPPLVIPFITCDDDMVDNNAPGFAELKLDLVNTPRYGGNGRETVHNWGLAAVDPEIAMTDMNADVLS